MTEFPIVVIFTTQNTDRSSIQHRRFYYNQYLQLTMKNWRETPQCSFRCILVDSFVNSSSCRRVLLGYQPWRVSGDPNVFESGPRGLLNGNFIVVTSESVNPLVTTSNHLPCLLTSDQSVLTNRTKGVIVQWKGPVFNIREKPTRDTGNYDGSGRIPYLYRNKWTSVKNR